MEEDTKRILHIVPTINCLPAGQWEDVRGADRWDEAERSMTAFAAAVEAEELRATFFVAPEALERFRGTVEGLQRAGHEAGLLCHPQLSGYKAYLGSYSFDRQQEILQLHRKIWEDALGQPAETFRPGFFSANDYTFHVACMAGFRQGSCSLPGRMDNDQCSMWFPSYPFPHHTDPLDRSVPGTIEFYEVPVTSDFEAATHVSYETYTPPHLRIEETDINEYARDLVERHIGRMQEDQLRVRAFTMVTSNIVGWGEEDDPHGERLQNLCETFRELADRRGMEIRAATLAEIHNTADQVHQRLRDLESGQ